MTSKVLIKWNDFNSSIPTSYPSLREERDFLDITLVSDDELKFDAHKVVLSASSTFFRNMLRRTSKNVNTLLFLNGVKSSDLQLVLDFVYNGEVKLHQESIPSFLEATSKLRISGLSEPIPGEESAPTPPTHSMDRSELTGFQEFLTNDKTEFNENLEYTIDNIINNEDGMKLDYEIPGSEANDEMLDLSQIKEETAVKPEFSKAQPNQHPPPQIIYDFKGNTDIELLDAKIAEYAVKLEGKRYKCGVCGRPNRDRSGIGHHIETHFAGLSFTCELCEKEFKSREAIRKHKQRHTNGGIKRPFNVYGY